MLFLSLYHTSYKKNIISISPPGRNMPLLFNISVTSEEYKQLTSCTPGEKIKKIQYSSVMSVKHDSHTVKYSNEMLVLLSSVC